MKNGTETLVAELPKCDYCESKARYDAKTESGPWAYLCESHFYQHGIRLGIGWGQKLVTKDELVGVGQ